jgi:steroid delta-isomerase-like uncharacterized protein
VSEQNKALVRRSLEEVYTAGNLAAIDDVFAADFVAYDPTFPDGLLRGRDGVRGNVTRGHAAFEGWRFDVEDLLADGDKVVARITMHGRQVGEFLGIAPSGKQVRVTGITINRVADGQIVERWGNWDTLGMLRQLGVVPKLDQIG